jgi:hypothetical protein
VLAPEDFRPLVSVRAVSLTLRILRFAWLVGSDDEGNVHVPKVKIGLMSGMFGGNIVEGMEG